MSGKDGKAKDRRDRYQVSDIRKRKG